MLTSYNGTAISYDLSGNPLNWRNASAMTWDGRRLSSMTLSDGTAMSFTYNSDALRTGKTVGDETVQYVWVDGELISEIRDGYTLHFYYENGEVIGFNYKTPSTSADYYYGKDTLGVIKYLYNSTGAVVTTYTYDAWGNTVSVSGTLALTVGTVNPFRYRGYYFDSETGFYYLQSRYYDPVVGRFLNADDAVIQVLSNQHNIVNFYAYCYNNCVNMYDEAGYSPSYIDNQSICRYASMRVGFGGTVANNGCGIVAVFNVMYYYDGSLTSFPVICKTLGAYSLYNLIGAGGINPNSIVKYLQKRFWYVRRINFVTNTINEKVGNCGGVIVLYRWGRLGYHYVAGVKNNRKTTQYYFYNDGDYPSKKSSTIFEYIKYLWEKNYTVVCVICVKWRI